MISSFDVLIAAAAAAGLDKQEAQRILEEGVGQEELQEALVLARKGTVSGVPHFTITGENGKKWVINTVLYHSLQR